MEFFGGVAVKTKTYMTIGAISFIAFYFLAGYILVWRSLVISWAHEVTEWEIFKSYFVSVYFDRFFFNAFISIVLTIAVICLLRIGVNLKSRLSV